MTREEAIDYLKGYLDEEVYTEKCRNAHEMAIKALEQEPCEDAISRQDALDCLTATGLKKFDFILDARDKIKNLLPATPQDPCSNCCNGNQIEKAKLCQKSYLAGMEHKQEPKWIPISERLPEEGELVLTQAIFKDDVKLCVSSRTDYNYWTGWGTRDINIIAWMPLPNPYKAERSDE